MKEKTGVVFSIGRDNQPVPGCTISKEIHGGENYITYFSLAANTDISAEIYPYHKLLITADGSMGVYGTDRTTKKLSEGVIGYEGKDHPIKAGENFCFAKEGLHSVKATKKFKMALLLTLE